MFKNEWIVYVTATAKLCIMRDVQAVQTSIDLTWSRVPDAIVKMAGHGGLSHTLVVHNREGKILLVARRLSDLDHYNEGTHL